MFSVSNSLSKPNSRNNWVDIAKAIAMFCIVLGHVDIKSNIQDFVYSFHIPVFIFLSGYCFSDKEKFSAFLKKKLLRIIVPYFFFGILAIVVYLLLGKYMVESALTSLGKCLYGLLIGNVKSNCMGFNLHLWFLPFIFSMSVIFYGLKKFTDFVALKLRVKNSVAYIVLFAVTFIVSVLILNFKTKIFFPFSMEIAVREMPFFSLGFMMKYSGKISCDIRCKSAKRIIIYSVSLVVFSAILVLFAYKNINHIPNGDFSVRYNRDIYGVPLYFYCAAFAGIGAVVCLSKLLPPFKWLIYFGRNTLAVLVMQKFFIMPARIIIEKLSVGNWLCIPASVLFSAVVIALCLLADLIIKKFFPFVYGVPYKNNNKS